MSKQVSDDALMELYRRLAQRHARGAGGFSDLDAAGRREYFRVARRNSRQRARAAEEAGAIEPNLGNVRQVLADAALMLLAVDGAGACHVRTVLASAFAKRPGAPLLIEQRIRSGRIKPKMVKP